MSLIALAAVISAGTTFSCTPTRVWDGDGPIWCAEGPKIRLAGIAAKEIDETCKKNQPCPPASGKAARDALVKLVGRATGTAATGHILISGSKLSCLSVGSGRGERTAAWCSSARYGDLSCALVKIGVAVRWFQYDGANVCRTRH